VRPGSEARLLDAVVKPTSGIAAQTPARGAHIGAMSLTPHEKHDENEAGGLQQS